MTGAHPLLPTTRKLRIVSQDARTPPPALAIVAARGAQPMAESAWWSQLRTWLAAGDADHGGAAAGDDAHVGRDEVGAWAGLVRRRAALLGFPVGELASFGAAICATSTGLQLGGRDASVTLALRCKLLSCGAAVGKAARELGKVVYRFVTSADLDTHEPADAGATIVRAKVRLGHIATLLELLAFATACHHAEPDLRDGVSSEAWASSVGEALTAASRLALTLTDVPGVATVAAALASAAMFIREAQVIFDAPSARRPRSACRAPATTRRDTPSFQAITLSAAAAAQNRRGQALCALRERIQNR